LKEIFNMFSRRFTYRTILMVFMIGLLSIFALGSAGVAEAAGAVGAVYTMTNAADGNEIAIFTRAADGTLTPAGTIPTDGLGSGGGLGNQGALVLSESNRFLFAVNAGSNEISVFRVLRPQGLRLVNVVPSGGEMPISLTVHRRLLYVLNEGGGGNITGFRIRANGQLTPISNSTRPLSGTEVDAAQIQLSPDGDLLVVTEKNTNLLATYTVGADGRASGPTLETSAGETPFGFAFGGRNRLYVSEAFGGAVDGSAISSYGVADDGDLNALDPSVGTTETAACWVVVTGNNRFVYTANTGSGSISGYRIAPDGNIRLLDDDGRTGVTGDGSSPIDLALGGNGRRFLYVLLAGTDSIAAFRIEANGSLAPLAGVEGLPDGANGLAAH
jgi:6-phosphogluconolactonase (cycloisomerase 2 family)